MYNRSAGLALVVPVTSQIKGYPFEVIIPPGLPVVGAVLADHVKSVDWRARKAERFSVLPAEAMRQVLQRAALLLTAG